MDGLAFADKFYRLVAAGDHNSTYKLATAIGLLQASQEVSDSDQGWLSTRRVSEVVIDRYWTQLSSTAGLAPLRQMHRIDQSSRIISAVHAIRDSGRGLSSTHIDTGSDPYRSNVRVVEKALLSYPLRLLQPVEDQFVYEVPEPARRSPAAFGSQFSGRLVLRAGVLELLQRSSGLLRPLIETEWVRRVARYNNYSLDETDLRRRLFGYARSSWPAGLREALQELQPNCFYCDGPLPSRTASSDVPETRAATHIDHFIPWARSFNDSIENLVLADNKCNSRKSAHLCSTELVLRWLKRLTSHQSDLRRIAESLYWPSDESRTLRIAVSMYRAAATSSLTLVWDAVALEAAKVDGALTAIETRLTSC